MMRANGSRAARGTPTRTAAVGGRRGAGGPSTQGFRPIDIVFSCAMGALLIILVVEYSRSGAIERKADRAARDTRALSQRLDDISGTLSTINGELSEARLANADVAALKRRLNALESSPARAEIDSAALSAAVDAALERRGEAFAADMQRRGEQIAEDVVTEFAKRVDVKGIEDSMRKTAANFRDGRREEGAPRRTADEKKADEVVAKGFDAMAEGIELFRKMQAGEITREEFRAKSRELREKARKQFDGMTPEEREAIGKRFGGLGRFRGRDGDNEGAGEDEGGGEKF